MAESTDTSVLSEKGKKTKRNPSPEHEEKQNSSPTMTLTPAVASRHEPSGETTVEPPGEGNITISPSKKRSCTTQDHDQTSIDATSESKVDSKSRHNVQPQEGNFNFLLSFERATPLPKVLRIKWRNRDDSSNKDKYDRYEDDNTVGGSVEQDDDEDDRTVGDNIEQGKKTKQNPSAEHEEKQNSSPPTTLTPAVASRKELSGKTTVEPRGEGNITISPSKKRSLTTQDYDQTSIDSTSESKVDSKARQAASDFVKILTRSDVSSNRLHIPRQDWDHFPALEIPNEGTSKWKQIYCFDDPKDENKKLPMSFGRKGNKRVIGKGWTKFVKEHGLQENDTVHFHRHNVQPQEGNFNFLLSFERATPLPKVLTLNKMMDEDDRTVGDNTEQGDDEDDNKAGDSIEQGDDEDDRTAGDGSEPSDDSADRGSNE
ncbi:hypothetical protein F0562_002280 [Nyssa sinensis]|uniref:TF-B3 domain-containing protein n=1 Tax=Nyssa sinensis TaxID=561372 RepID=A0A5J5C6I9_9ASTE|nr:hypothetical protein F0562_002280 [Nyssa sinensis]